MSVYVDIHWEPSPAVFGEAILEVAEALEHTELPLALAAEEVSADIRRNFEGEHGPDGEPWAEWSDNYIDYAEAYPNIGILRQSDELYQAATSPEAIVLDQHTMMFDESVLPERGIWHQEGIPYRTTKSGAANPLPQRAFLGLSVESRDVIFGIFGEWFDGAIRIYETSTGRLGLGHQLRSPTSGGRFVSRASLGRSALPTLRR